MSKAGDDTTNYHGRECDTRRWENNLCSSVRQKACTQPAIYDSIQRTFQLLYHQAGYQASSISRPYSHVKHTTPTTTNSHAIKIPADRPTHLSIHHRTAPPTLFATT